MQDCDTLLVSVPIYFNLPCAQSVALLNRAFCLFGPPSDGKQESAAKKKLGVLVTCGGSDPAKMKENISMAIGFFQQFSEQRIEVFPNVSKKLHTPEYMEQAKDIGIWAAK